MDTEINQLADERISTATIQLLRHKENAFITSLLLNMPREATDKVKSISLEGTKIQYNPEYIMSLSSNDVLFNLVHIAWHVGGGR